MPIIGLVLAVVTMTRPDPNTSKHGLKILGLTILAFIVWVAIYSSAANHAAEQQQVYYYRTY